MNNIAPQPRLKQLLELYAPDTQALQGFFQELCQQPMELARFLNSLSLLEHIGSRKIMLSQMGGPMSEEVLQHLAEEARHAFHFRRQAEKVAGQPMSYVSEDLLVAPAARGYFGRLDVAISKQCTGSSDRQLPYLYVTTIVELRALWFYENLQIVSRRNNIALSLTGVINEEHGHLGQMFGDLEGKDPLFGQRLAIFSALEQKLFQRWFDQARAALK